MHECKGVAKIKVEIEFPIRGAFNGNYRSGEEELEDTAVEGLMSLLPQDFKVEVLDVNIRDYQLLDKEIEHED